jgi:hypothetical protein
MKQLTGEVLIRLEAIRHDVEELLELLERGREKASPAGFRETKERLVRLRDDTQELFDTVSEIPLEEKRN